MYRSPIVINPDRPNWRATLGAEALTLGGAALLYGGLEYLKGQFGFRGIGHEAYNVFQSVATAAYITGMTRQVLRRPEVHKIIALVNYAIAGGLLGQQAYSLLMDLFNRTETSDGLMGARLVGGAFGIVPGVRTLYGR